MVDELVQEERFHSEKEAWDFLSKEGYLESDHCIIGLPGKDPTDEEWEAIQYLLDYAGWEITLP